MSKVRVTALEHAIASKSPLDDTQAIVARAHAFLAFLSGNDSVSIGACATANATVAAAAVASLAAAVAPDAGAVDPNAPSAATATAPIAAPASATATTS